MGGEKKKKEKRKKEEGIFVRRNVTDHHIYISNVVVSDRLCANFTV